MTWDHRYRMLNEGEIVLATDEIQNDDGSWRAAVCVGSAAPPPYYTSHRVYRRAQGTEAGTGETACGLGPKGDGPVGNADAPLSGSPSNPSTTNTKEEEG